MFFNSIDKQQMEQATGKHHQRAHSSKDSKRVDFWLGLANDMPHQMRYKSPSTEVTNMFHCAKHH